MKSKGSLTKNEWLEGRISTNKCKCRSISFNDHIRKVDYLKLDLPDVFVVSRNGKLTECGENRPIYPFQRS